MVRILKAVIMIPGDRYQTIVIRKEEESGEYLPQIDLSSSSKDALSVVDIEEIEKLLQIKINLVSPNPLHRDSNDIPYFGMIASVSRDIKLPDQYTHVHPRKAIRVFKNHNQKEVIDKIFDWIEQSDYSLELLSHNLDKMR